MVVFARNFHYFGNSNLKKIIFLEKKSLQIQQVKYFSDKNIS